VKIIRDDGRRLRLRRAIKGETAYVHVEEQSAEVSTPGPLTPGTSAAVPPITPAAPQEIILLARGKTMQDEAGGLQRFLLEWLRWPRVEISTFKGTASEVYLENLVPSFYIDQTEGWADIQAQQIGRYGQLEIKEIAVEYLLGAIGAINTRVALRQSAQRQTALARGLKAPIVFFIGGAHLGAGGVYIRLGAPERAVSRHGISMERSGANLSKEAAANSSFMTVYPAELGTSKESNRNCRKSWEKPCAEPATARTPTATRKGAVMPACAATETSFNGKTCTGTWYRTGCPKFLVQVPATFTRKRV
jgi:hypothetical protein